MSDEKFTLELKNDHTDDELVWEAALELTRAHARRGGLAQTFEDRCYQIRDTLDYARTLVWAYRHDPWEGPDEWWTEHDEDRSEPLGNILDE